MAVYIQGCIPYFEIPTNAEEVFVYKKEKNLCMYIYNIL